MASYVRNEVSSHRVKRSSSYGVVTTGVWERKPLFTKMLCATLEYEINHANASTTRIGVLINSQPILKGNKLRSMSGDARDFNNIETRAVIKVFSPRKTRRRRKFTPFWQKQWLVSFLVGLRTYQHPCTISHISTTSRRALSSSFFFLQGKAPKEIHAILTETLTCFLPGRAKDLSASLYIACE